MWSAALTFARTVRKKWAMSLGVEYPTVSGRLMVVAPAWITASITWHRKSTSLRSASSAENSTSSTCARASRTLSAAASMHWLRVMFSFFSRCRSEVASTMCTRGFAAGSSAQKVFSRSRRRHRARAAMVGRRISVATRRTASASFGEAIGKPASMMSTPNASSARASASFSSTCSEKPGRDVAEEDAPVLGRSIRGDERRRGFVATHKHFEEILGGIRSELLHAEVFEHEQVDARELLDEIAAGAGRVRLGEVAGQIEGAAHERAVARANRPDGDRRRNVRFADAGRPNEQDALVCLDKPRA